MKMKPKTIMLKYSADVREVKNAIKLVKELERSLARLGKNGVKLNVTTPKEKVK